MAIRGADGQGSEGCGIIPEGHLGCLRNGLQAAGWPGHQGKHEACSPEPVGFADAQPLALTNHASLSLGVRSWVSAQLGGCVCPSMCDGLNLISHLSFLVLSHYQHQAPCSNSPAVWVWSQPAQQPVPLRDASTSSPAPPAGKAARHARKWGTGLWIQTQLWSFSLLVV